MKNGVFWLNLVFLLDSFPQHWLKTMRLVYAARA